MQRTDRRRRMIRYNVVSLSKFTLYLTFKNALYFNIILKCSYKSSDSKNAFSLPFTAIEYIDFNILKYNITVQSNDITSKQNGIRSPIRIWKPGDASLEITDDRIIKTGSRTQRGSIKSCMPNYLKGVGSYTV